MQADEEKGEGRTADVGRVLLTKSRLLVRQGVPLDSHNEPVDFLTAFKRLRKDDVAGPESLTRHGWVGPRDDKLTRR